MKILIIVALILLASGVQCKFIGGDWVDNRSQEAWNAAKLAVNLTKRYHLRPIAVYYVFKAKDKDGTESYDMEIDIAYMNEGNKCQILGMASCTFTVLMSGEDASLAYELCKEVGGVVF